MIKHADFAFKICDISGKPFEQINHNVMISLFKLTDIQPETIHLAVKAGFLLDDLSLTDLLTQSSIYLSNSQNERIFTALVSDELVNYYGELALRELFSNDRAESIRICDFLLTRFKFDSDTVGRAFYRKKSLEETQEKSSESLPFTTTYGNHNGGISDSFWTFICSRFGATHPFTEACMIDILVGGTHGTNSNGKDEKEMYTRESLALLIEVGLQFTPKPFVALVDFILSYKTVPHRFVDYMSKLELFIVDDAELQIEWVAILKSTVAENIKWNIIATPEAAVGRPAYEVLGGLMQIMSDNVWGTLRDARRFYQCVSNLIDHIGAPKTGLLPFSIWLNELDNPAPKQVEVLISNISVPAISLSNSWQAWWSK